MRIKNRSRVVGAVLAATALVLTACGSGDDVADGPTITIGAQDFGESAILAEVYGQALTTAGYSVEIQPLGGFRDIVLGAFESEEINFTPEYAASMLEFLNGDVSEATGDAAETTGLLQGYLDELSLMALEPSPAVDTNAFVVTPDTSSSLGITAVSDLAGQELTLGGPPDCETNPFCLPGLSEVYGIDLSGSFLPLDAGSVTVQALEAGEIDVAVLFSSSGVIADKGWILLEDDMNMFAADNIVPVVSSAVADAYGDDFASLVNEISASMTTAELTELNRRYDIDTEDPDAIAADWLSENGFGEG